MSRLLRARPRISSEFPTPWTVFGRGRSPGPRGRRKSETRTFKTMTGSLRVMRDWLLECGVTIAAMESTSTYWKPPFYCLEDHMTVWLLNAAHMHAVPGPEERCSRQRVDCLPVGARAARAVVRAAAGHPPVADADPTPHAVDGRPHPGDHQARAHVGRRVDQALGRRLQPEHRVGTGPC